jgi:glycine dehydrogenase subunit 1
MSFLPITDQDRQAMLDKIGVASLDELLATIPEKLRLKRPLDISAASEMEVLRTLAALAADNSTDLVCFAGGGVYDHFIPAAVAAVISRPEFMTAYTPYQPEVSQGTLQVIYEFQSHICRLTGMEVANASLYDGATAAAEAVLLACRATRREKVIVSRSVSPMFRDVISTYLCGRDIELVEIPMDGGRTDLNRLADQVDDKIAAVLVAQPNFFGHLEEIEAIERTTHEHGAKLVMAVDPIAQALLKTPGELGADIVVGEGQPLGIPLAFGGPLLGFMAVRKELVRSVPGRIVGRTEDVDGRPGFVLTLQTREQHIRRDKATSNICTNQALCATAATVYMSLMGPQGLKQTALLSAERAQQAARELVEVSGCQLAFENVPFVREFALETPLPAGELVGKALEHGLLAGVDAGRWYPEMQNCLIVAATEKRTSAEVSRLSETVREITADYAMSQV